MAVQKSAINPGEPEQSGMIGRIHSKDPDEQMPPPASKKKLTPEEIAKLEQWIGEGRTISRTGRSFRRWKPRCRQ